MNKFFFKLNFYSTVLKSFQKMLENNKFLKFMRYLSIYDVYLMFHTHVW